jgi:hypothetical protein
MADVFVMADVHGARGFRFGIFIQARGVVKMATILTGNGEFVAGSALDNTQTDDFFNLGAGNTIVGLGGNINVTGLGPDTATTVYLTSVSPAGNVGVTDTISENGSGNTLSNDFFGTVAPITGSTISFTVNGNGGGNTVDLTQSSTSTITVSANGFGGGNNVTIGNTGGTNTVSLGGLLDKVTLNGDATNTVTLGAGSATVNIGFLGRRPLRPDEHGHTGGNRQPA